MNRRRSLCFVVLLASWLSQAGVLFGADQLDAGSGSFVFNNAEGNSGKPITVWYHRPKDLKADAKILFVMHGTSRTGEKFRDSWVRYSERFHLLLIAPEFSAERYEGGRRYGRGNVLTKGGSKIEESKWTLSAVEHLFDHIRKRTNNTSATYYIYGHSAGAQFVHRFVLLKPDARIKAAVAANAGWYTMPTFTTRYPYGLDGISYSSERLERACGKKLIILLGEEDTDENHSQLSRTAGAVAQGKHRLERGRNFYEKASDYAKKRNIRLRWELHTVPGAGHSNSKMAKAAARLLFGDVREEKASD